jgi:hypothetical protein
MTFAELDLLLVVALVEEVLLGLDMASATGTIGALLDALLDEELLRGEDFNAALALVELRAPCALVELGSLSIAEPSGLLGVQSQRRPEPRGPARP